MAQSAVENYHRMTPEEKLVADKILHPYKKVEVKPEGKKK